MDLTIWLFNIAMENPNHKWRFIASVWNIYQNYGIFTNICPINATVLSVNIPAPWSIWEWILKEIYG